jgi:hypothetical protein
VPREVSIKNVLDVRLESTDVLDTRDDGWTSGVLKPSAELI